MRVIVTGTSGFLGRRLAEALTAHGSLAGSDGRPRAITELVLVDRVPQPAPAAIGMTVRAIAGDMTDPALLDRLGREGFDSLFHLAASLTLEAERDPDRAWAVNVDPLRRLIAGAWGRPRVVFTSSIAVFGGTLPDSVDEDVRPAPLTSYGTHKAVNDLLLADASRHGRIDGRSLRLPIVLVRPGAPVPAISDQVAAIVREPLAGRPTVSRFDPDRALPVASAGAVVRALIALHETPETELPEGRAVHLPGLGVTPRDMVAALARRAGEAAAALVREEPDAAVQTIVAGWPRIFASRHAAQLGIAADAAFDAVIADHLADLAGKPS
jgi:nucleoside-diphosphate-sugar epimerase